MIDTLYYFCLLVLFSDFYSISVVTLFSLEVVVPLLVLCSCVETLLWIECLLLNTELVIPLLSNIFKGEACLDEALFITT